jgi:hypothetical protein
LFGQDGLVFVLEGVVGLLVVLGFYEGLKAALAHTLGKQCSPLVWR